MMSTRPVIVALMVLVPSLAWAAPAVKCDKELKALEAAKDAAVAPAFAAVAKCNPAAAGEAFGSAMKRTGDVGALSTLATTAIDAGMTTPVHEMLEAIPDYAAREETARAIGAACAGDPAVEAFVVGLHDALKDRAFTGWAGALRSCPAEAVTAKLEAAAAEPPARAFDDKYNTVVDVYAAKQRAAALPALEKAATAAAANGGPLPVIVDAMVKAVTPEGIGGDPSDADRDALVAALGRVAGSANADGLRKIAGALIAVDAVDAAGALMPKLYADRVQENGGFLYGLAAVETCDDNTVVHWAVVEDASHRWSIADAVEAPAKAFKPKLKCGAPVAVQLSPEPVKDAGAVEAWAEELAAKAGEGAKLKAEKKVVLA
ncbi:MAG: hypothetical protein ABMB14_38255, partial [Myxococcota bacterium]